MLGDMLEEQMAASLPVAAVAMFRVMLDRLAELDERIAHLDRELAGRASEDKSARRLRTIPSIGPITATALTALAPPGETFAQDRSFAACLGLTPLQRSTGGNCRPEMRRGDSLFGGPHGNRRGVAGHSAGKLTEVRRG